jgi:hypothetical protein
MLVPTRYAARQIEALEWRVAITAAAVSAAVLVRRSAY